MAGPITPPQYVVRDGDTMRDRDRVLAIWSGNLGRTDRIAAKYDWFYLGCPYGAPLLQLLQHQPSGTWVGTASAGQRRMLWRGREIHAGVLVDLAVLPEHRSLGPALILQQGLIAAGARELDLLYGFPNPKAAAVFKRIGYERLTEIARYVRVLRHAHYLQQRMPGWLARPMGRVADLAFAARDLMRRALGPRLKTHWASAADARMDALWAASNKGDGLVATRDSQHARWRFDASPMASTRYLLLARTNEDSLYAWFATQAVAETLHVRDFWSMDGIGGMDKSCLLALVEAARKAGHAALSVEIAADPAHVSDWMKCGFVERGKRPVFGRWSVARDAGTRMELFLTSADEDE
ncbi:MAG: hypothetical protein ACREO7_05750 [Pseudoxanthomonas sp.]